MPASKSLSIFWPWPELERVAPAGRAVRIVVPSVWLTITDGIVTVASVPPIVMGEPGTLFTITTARAPTFCAFLTLTVKLQAPRSMSATFPLIAGPLINAPQPSLAAPLPSSTTTRLPETEVGLAGTLPPNNASIAV